MNLTVLGCFGPFPKEGGATSSYLLKVAGKKIALDFGSGAFSRLLKVEKPENLDAIFLSHLHFDHISDMGVLIYYFQTLFAKGYDKKLTVIMPNDDSNDTFGIANCPYFNVIKIDESENVHLGDISCSFLKMKHPIPSYSIKVYGEGKVFAYSGDTNECDNLLPLYVGADTVLVDGAFLYKDWAKEKPHLSVKHIVDYTNKCGNKSIITHLNPKYTKEELIFEIGEGNCEIAEEGKCYKI